MKKYRVVFAISYDVEAVSEMDAEDKAIMELEKEFGEKFADTILRCFGMNVVEKE